MSDITVTEPLELNAVNFSTNDFSIIDNIREILKENNCRLFSITDEVLSKMSEIRNILKLHNLSKITINENKIFYERKDGLINFIFDQTQKRKATLDENLVKRRKLQKNVDNTANNNNGNKENNNLVFKHLKELNQSEHNKKINEINDKNVTDMIINDESKGKNFDNNKYDKNIIENEVKYKNYGQIKVDTKDKKKNKHSSTRSRDYNNKSINDESNKCLINDNINKADKIDFSSSDIIKKNKHNKKIIENAELILSIATYSNNNHLYGNEDLRIKNDESLMGFVQDCIVVEIQGEINNCKLLEYHYKIGSNLNFLYQKMSEKYPEYPEKTLNRAIIKGTGIIDSFIAKFSNLVSTRQRARRFYNNTLKVYKAYNLFPYPVAQIHRAEKVSPDKLMKVGAQEEFREFLKELKELISENHKYFANIDNYLYRPNEYNNCHLITDEIIKKVDISVANPILKSIK